MRDLTLLYPRSVMARPTDVILWSRLKNAEFTDWSIFAENTGLVETIEVISEGLIYDFKGDYVSRFYEPKRDILFNPLDCRSAGWNLFSDIKTKLDINVMASSLIPPVYTGDTFWNDAARGVFSGILHYLWQHDRSNIMLATSFGNPALFSYRPGNRLASLDSRFKYARLPAKALQQLLLGYHQQ